MVWRVDVRVNPVDPACGLTASGAPQAGIRVVGGRPTERLNSRRPSQACGGRGKARKLRRWSTSSWSNNGRKRWGLVQTGGSTSRGLFGPMLPCAASGVGGGGSGGAACYRRPQRAGIRSIVAGLPPSSAIAQRRFGKARRVPAKADARLVSTSANGGAPSSHVKKKRGPNVQAEPLGNVHLHRLHFRWQPRPSRGEKPDCG